MAAPSTSQEIFGKICQRFQIGQLSEHQKEAIQAVKEGRDIYVGTKTGSGKSLTYECIPLLFEDESVMTVIIAPLKSIMLEQVERLNGLGFLATYISSEKGDENEVINGHYQFVFGNPEILVGSVKWREAFKNPKFAGRHKLTVIDEAHTVVHWGESHSEGPAFREWFSRIGELRSLSLNVPIVALTATSSPSNRRKIMKSLCFKTGCKVIIDSPDRKNIKLNVINISNNADMDNVFSWIIGELKSKKQNFERHLIFCTSIKDCSLIYSMLLRNLKHLKLDGLVNMFHSKTPETVKHNIRLDMNNENGEIRVLVCTNAAGMGVNFKNLNNVVHYGVPHDMDTFVQQMGRAGRDGSLAQEIIIFKNNKKSLKKIDPEMIKLIKSDISECRRSVISQSYMSVPATIDISHLCCDLCALKCSCDNATSHQSHPLCMQANVEEETGIMLRDVSEGEKDLLRQKLTSYKDTLPSEDFLKLNLTDENVNTIVNNCDKIFNIDDVIRIGSVWKYEIALNVINMINEVFEDEEMYHIFSHSEDDSSDDE